MIAVIDYGMGNVASIRNMIRKVGGEAVVVTEPQKLGDPSAIILPGVGAFDNAMEKLEIAGWDKVLRAHVLERGVPFLGICLGMQLLFERSEEGVRPGLGFVKGQVLRFLDGMRDNNARLLRIPHMGWNEIQPRFAGSALFKGLEDNSRFYFVHSYHVVCADSQDIAATCLYGNNFVCAIARRNVFATQFHPEKSHRFGMKLFQNFLEIAC